eukprot:759250-Hanusia_phi.AAC.3
MFKDWVEILNDVDISEELRCCSRSPKAALLLKCVFKRARGIEVSAQEKGRKKATRSPVGIWILHVVVGALITNSSALHPDWRDAEAGPIFAGYSFETSRKAMGKKVASHRRVRNEDEISEESFESDDQGSSPAALEKTIEEIESDGSSDGDFETAVDEAEKVWTQPSVGCFLSPFNG